MAQLHALSEYAIDTIGLQWALLAAIVIFLICGYLFLRIVVKTVRSLRVRRARNKFYISLINKVESKLPDES